MNHIDASVLAFASSFIGITIYKILCMKIERLTKRRNSKGDNREEWTKFDQNDESTFPPCKGVYLVCRGVEPYFREAKFYGKQVGFGDTCVILWRPLPKLPLEIDGRYIREDRPECFSYDRKV